MLEIVAITVSYMVALAAILVVYDCRDDVKQNKKHIEDQDYQIDHHHVRLNSDDHKFANLRDRIDALENAGKLHDVKDADIRKAVLAALGEVEERRRSDDLD